MQGPPQGYGAPPQGQYAPPPMAHQSHAPQYPGPSGPPPQQQAAYGGPPPQQSYQGPPDPAYSAASYSSYPGPAQGPPPGGLPGGGQPGPGPASGVGMKRPLEGSGAEAPDAKRQVQEPGPPETVLRLLVPVKRVGAVIGKHGSVIKEIKETTGCRMRIVESVPGADERVVIISAPDDPAQERNAAELGLFEVHKRVIEGEEPLHSSGGAPQGILTRMLVCHSQAGSIIGKSGVQIKAIRDVSGSHIKILPPDELPQCALSNDRVVQMVGQPQALAVALGEVSKIIRHNPPKELPGGCPPSLSAITGLPPGPAAGGLMGGGHHGQPHSGGYHQPLRSAQTVATCVKNVLVPDGQVGSIIGSGGSNINRIREASGCRIKVHDPNPADPAQRTIECHGTEEQIAAAERLLEPYQNMDGDMGHQFA